MPDDDVEDALARLWDPNDLPATEQRFRRLLTETSGVDAALVTTQIARTHTLRRHIPSAEAVLLQVETGPFVVDQRVAVRLLLERARIARTERRHDDAYALALDAFRAAGGGPGDVGYGGSSSSGEPLLAAEAAHLLSLLTRTRSDATRWDEKALQLARLGTGQRALRRQGALSSTLGTRARTSGHLEQALEYFQGAVAAYTEMGDAEQLRIAQWQVGNTLRLMGHFDDAWRIQTQLREQGLREGVSDVYVDEELAALAAVAGYELS